MEGYISIHRKICDNWVWQDKPFSRGQAWIDILLMANHKDNKFLLGNEIVSVERGSFITSEIKLMVRWGWGKSKTRSFLKLLEKDGMIVKKTDRKRTTIKLCNYNVYQPLANQSQTNDRPVIDQSQTNHRPIADTNNNDNNVNNDNNEKKIKDMSSKSFTKECKEIINYLNEICEKSYKASTPKTEKLIVARIKEGFTVEDFKKVITTKYQEWHNDEKMNKYLRPETLFGTKFEGYLNQTFAETKDYVVGDYREL